MLSETTNMTQSLDETVFNEYYNLDVKHL